MQKTNTDVWFGVVILLKLMIVSLRTYGSDCPGLP